MGTSSLNSSPHTRTTVPDEYGGSFENRLRFLREILEAVRREVKDAIPVGVRISADECLEGGMTVADSTRIAQTLETARAYRHSRRLAWIAHELHEGHRRERRAGGLPAPDERPLSLLRLRRLGRRDRRTSLTQRPTYC